MMPPHRNFFCAIHAAHLIGAAGAERGRLHAATSSRGMPRRVWLIVMGQAMVVFHWGDIATDDGVTLLHGSNLLLCNKADLSLCDAAMSDFVPLCCRGRLSGLTALALS